MERLTTDQENATFSCFNIFYAKGGEIWVRGGGPYPEYQDVTLVQWIRAAAQKHGLNLTAEDPENLGDEMYDALQDGDETVEGIVALLHAAAVQATEMRERLKPIEDILGDDYDLDRMRELAEADRDGRCVVRMCKTGDKIYVVGSGKIVEAEIHDMYLLEESKDIEFLVFFDCDDDCSGCPFNSWRQDHDGEWSCDGEYGDGSVKQSDIGKSVFLSREAAELAMKEE